MDISVLKNCYAVRRNLSNIVATQAPLNTFFRMVFEFLMHKCFFNGFQNF